MPEIRISDESQRRLDYLVKAGTYDSPEDALESMIAMSETDEEKLAALRKEIQKGLDSIKAGRVRPFDAEEIIREGRRRLEQQQET